MIEKLFDFTKVKNAKFDREKSPLELVDGVTTSFVAKSYAFSEDRMEVDIFYDATKPARVKVAEGLEDAVVFKFFAGLTGKRLTFKDGVLVEIETPPEKEVGKVVSDKQKTRSCSTPMLLNR